MFEWENLLKLLQSCVCRTGFSVDGSYCTIMNFLDYRLQRLTGGSVTKKCALLIEPEFLLLICKEYPLLFSYSAEV